MQTFYRDNFCENICEYHVANICEYLNMLRICANIGIYRKNVIGIYRKNVQIFELLRMFACSDALFLRPIDTLLLADSISFVLRPEVCTRVKTDLFLWQKRPISMAKQTYFYGKRDLRAKELCSHSFPLYLRTYVIRSEKFIWAKETYS